VSKPLQRQRSDVLDLVHGCRSWQARDPWGILGPTSREFADIAECFPWDRHRSRKLVAVVEVGGQLCVLVALSIGGASASKLDHVRRAEFLVRRQVSVSHVLETGWILHKTNVSSVRRR